MKRERRKREKKIHLVPLIAGCYAALLGLGLIRIGLFGSQGGVAPLRLLGGLVITGFGLLGIWDGLRDLYKSQPAPDKTPAPQYIFIGVDGKRTSSISPELLRTQLATVIEAGGDAKVVLHILPPLPVSGGQYLDQLHGICGDGEKPLCLIGFLQSDDAAKKGMARLKAMELEQAAALFERLLARQSADFSDWGVLEVEQRQGTRPSYQCLTVFGESWRNDYRFFSDKDLELALQGLADGKYRRVELTFDGIAFHAYSSQEQQAMITLRMLIRQEEQLRMFEKTGTVTQVNFWLVQILDKGTLEGVYGWQEVTAQ